MVEAGPGPQSRGLVICTLVLLVLVGLNTAAFQPVAWMWMVWSLLAIVTIVLVITDRPTTLQPPQS